MQFTLPTPDINSWPIPEGELQPNQMGPIGANFAEASNIFGSLPATGEWGDPASAKVIRFQGTSRQETIRCINRDPSIGGTVPTGGTQTSNQLLAEVYIPMGWKLIAYQSTYISSEPTAIPGCTRRFGSAIYKFKLLDNAGQELPAGERTMEPVNRLNAYTFLVGYQFDQGFYYWVGFGGVGLDHVINVLNIGFSELPIISPDPLPPLPPFPSSPPPPPPPPPPPCDVPIGNDSNDGYFCMSFAEYNAYIASNQGAQTALDNTASFLRGLP